MPVKSATKARRLKVDGCTTHVPPRSWTSRDIVDECLQMLAAAPDGFQILTLACAQQRVAQQELVKPMMAFIGVRISCDTLAKRRSWPGRRAGCRRPVHVRAKHRETLRPLLKLALVVIERRRADAHRDVPASRCWAGNLARTNGQARAPDLSKGHPSLRHSSLSASQCNPNSRHRRPTASWAPWPVMASARGSRKRCGSRCRP